MPNTIDVVHNAHATLGIHVPIAAPALPQASTTTMEAADVALPCHSAHFNREHARLPPPAQHTAAPMLLQLEDALQAFDHGSAGLPQMPGNQRQQAQLWPQASLPSAALRAQHQAQDQERFVIPLALRRWGNKPGDAASTEEPAEDSDVLQRLLGILRLDTAVAAHDYAGSGEPNTFCQWRRHLARRRRAARQHQRR